MSHATGKVRFNDGTTFWFEYNGTLDFLTYPWLYETAEELRANWRRNDDPEKCCPCCSGHDHEPVVVANDCGDGSVQPGIACRECKLLLPPTFEDAWAFNFKVRRPKDKEDTNFWEWFDRWNDHVKGDRITIV